VTAHPFGVSDRQLQILSLVADGLDNAAIGAKLGLETNTVKSHLRNTARRMGCGDRAGMVALAYRTRMLAVPGEPLLPPEVPEQMVAMARMVVSNQPLGSLRAVAKQVVAWADARPGRAA